MTLQEVQQALEELFQSIGLEFKYNIDGKRLRATSNLSLKGHDDDIAASLIYYPSGVCSFRFFFDKLTTDLASLTLLNDFNLNVYGLKAYIGDDDYLTIAYEVEGLAAEDVANFASRVLNYLADDDIGKYLLPLTALTTAE